MFQIDKILLKESHIIVTHCLLLSQYFEGELLLSLLLFYFSFQLVEPFLLVDSHLPLKVTALLLQEMPAPTRSGTAIPILRIQLIERTCTLRSLQANSRSFFDSFFEFLFFLFNCSSYFAFDSFLFFAVDLQSLLYYFFMVLPLSLLFYLLFQHSTSRLKGTAFLFVLVTETTDDVRFRHEFLHLVAKVLLTWILESV